MIAELQVTENTTISFAALWLIGGGVVGAAAWIITAIYGVRSTMRDSVEGVRTEMREIGHKMELHVQRIDAKLDGNVKRDAIHVWIASLVTSIRSELPNFKPPETLP